jgi:carbamoyltransferase
MIVLGLHGWEGTHDAAAALLIDGKVVAHIEEERLSRRKHAISAVPRLASHAVLHRAGLSIEDVDIVSYGWDLPEYGRTRKRPWTDFTSRDVLHKIFGSVLRREPRFEWVPHHLAHAAASFYSSGFDQAAVVVVDGQGEGKSISVYRGDRSNISLIRDWGPAFSLGFLYEAATTHCGFSFLDAGKTMGLAAYAARSGDSLPIEWRGDDIVSPIAEGLSEEEVVAQWGRILSARYGEPPRPEQVFDPVRGSFRWKRDDPQRHAPHVAAVAQETIERVLLTLVRYAQQQAGCSNVALSGGVALNCVANALLRNVCGRLFIPPFVHDAGAALGAAMLSTARCGIQVTAPGGADLGLGYSESDLAAAIATSKLSYVSTEDSAVDAAQRLLRGEVIGWFQGRSEVGPRALGCRSILALPYQERQRARINALKGREAWRPLAPSMLRSETSRVFGEVIDSPYMLLSLPMKAECAKMLGAVAHVDGSTRVQTVADTETGAFSRLLQEVKRQTGMAVVLNTSFNAHFEPVVCTPADAIRTFAGLGLDGLVLGPFVLSKPHPGAD